MQVVGGAVKAATYQLASEMRKSPQERDMAKGIGRAIVAGTAAAGAGIAAVTVAAGVNMASNLVAKNPLSSMIPQNPLSSIVDPQGRWEERRQKRVAAAKNFMKLFF